MTDREQAGIRGAVKICRTEREYLYPDRRWVLSTTDTFSLQGNLLERHHLNPDGSRWSTICRYDAQERLAEKEEIPNESHSRQLFSYHYDAQGRLDRVMLHSAQEGDRVFESVQYAADGTTTKTSYPTPLDDARRQNTGVFAEAMLHVSLDAVVVTTLLDASGRPIRKVLYDRDDRVIRRIGFHYDALGQLLEEGELVAGSIREDFRNTYRYDARGRQVEAHRRWSDLGGTKRSFSYDDRGNITEEIIEQNDGLMMTDGSGSQAWSERFVYEYDDGGNWIQRTTETIPHAGEARVSMIERRELTY